MIECLAPNGEFNPEHWVFEQLNLRLQPINLCGVTCPGPSGLNTKKSGPDLNQISGLLNEIDPRWAHLKRLL